MKYTYINRATYSGFEEYDMLLNPDIYTHVGTTWEDYEKGKSVLLSDEQVAFHGAHPEATAKEVWDMQLAPRTVEKAKREMIDAIANYDISASVNSFTVNNEIEGWFSPSQRTSYKASIDAAKLLNIPTLQFFIGDTLLTVTPEQAEQMLAQILMYADQCYIVTREHVIAVKAMDNVEEIDNFDYTAGYPEKLNFDVPVE